MATRVTKKIAPVKGRRLRVTRLDGCGRPVYGDDVVVTSKGFISVGFTANTSDSDEIRVTNASGETIAFEPAVTSLDGYGVEMAFGEVDPDIFTLITGQRVALDADGNHVGFHVNTDVTLDGQGFALEVWTGAPAAGACDDDASEGVYGYLLLPFLQGGILGDFSVENGAVTFTISGAQTKDGNSWGQGPYDVQLNSAGEGNPKVAGPLVEPLEPNDHLNLILVEVAPPAVEDGSRPLLDPNADPVASVTATRIGTTRGYTITVTPDADTPDSGVWYDFGDDTWDYVDQAGGDTTHTYATAGVKTIRASTNGTWVTTTVTVV